MRPCPLLPALAIAAVLCACAPPVVSEPAQLTPVPEAQQQTITIARDIEVALVWDYKSAIRSGSQWRLVGRVREGGVYRPVGSVFAVEGRNVHEAYLVVRERRIVGFYLVAESRFATLDRPISLD